MVTDGWVAHKLQSHINSKQAQLEIQLGVDSPPHFTLEVAQPPADADVWACWEDMGTVDG